MGQCIYIVFSSTPYKIGSMIRAVTGESFNHVSIALDSDMKEMYSFARRYYRTPLYGGFVRESTSRYYISGRRARIQICRIPVTPGQYQMLAQRLHRMLGNREYYLYNHLSIFTIMLRKPIPLKGAYTCVEFCVECLHELGLPVTPGKYYTIGMLQHILKDQVIYEGPLPDTGAFDSVYFQRRPVCFPILHTLRDMAALLPRFRK